jgi:excisionase family DNA binding protein
MIYSSREYSTKLNKPTEVTTMLAVDEEMYTPKEIADYLKVDKHTVYRWLREGELKAIRFRREYRISESQLREFIEEHRADRKD